MSERQSMAATGLVSTVDARIKRDFIDVGFGDSGMVCPEPRHRLCLTACVWRLKGHSFEVKR